jgi:hypothetical protein
VFHWFQHFEIVKRQFDEYSDEYSVSIIVFLFINCQEKIILKKIKTYFIFQRYCRSYKQIFYNYLLIKCISYLVDLMGYLDLVFYIHLDEMNSILLLYMLLNKNMLLHIVYKVLIEHLHFDHM